MFADSEKDRDKNAKREKREGTDQLNSADQSIGLVPKKSNCFLCSRRV